MLMPSPTWSSLQILRLLTTEESGHPCRSVGNRPPPPTTPVEDLGVQRGLLAVIDLPLISVLVESQRAFEAVTGQVRTLQILEMLTRDQTAMVKGNF